MWKVLVTHQVTFGQSTTGCSSLNDPSFVLAKHHPAREPPARVRSRESVEGVSPQRRDDATTFDCEGQVTGTGSARLLARRSFSGGGQSCLCLRLCGFVTSQNCREPPARVRSRESVYKNAARPCPSCARGQRRAETSWARNAVTISRVARKIFVDKFLGHRAFA
jgi:hypothetical protein